ncbi:riboflavin kinase [Gautieria morchelliformis]|nr:riboflavin kinase [Gautieria morchelliformis]
MEDKRGVVVARRKLAAESIVLTLSIYMSATAQEISQLDARPAAPVQTESFRQSRPLLVGEDSGPSPPFPIRLAGSVQRGFGRGGKDLGCPTANLPDESLEPIATATKTGIYFGYAQVLPSRAEEQSTWVEDDSKVWPMVMSLGWNPFYKNEKLTAEIHIMHNYQSDFYGHELRAVVLGYIRPELDYTSRDALINDIDTDKRVGEKSVNRPTYRIFAQDPHFKSPT